MTNGKLTKMYNRNIAYLFMVVSTAIFIRNKYLINFTTVVLLGYAESEFDSPAFIPVETCFIFPCRIDSSWGRSWGRSIACGWQFNASNVLIVMSYTFFCCRRIYSGRPHGPSLKIVLTVKTETRISHNNILWRRINKKQILSQRQLTVEYFA